VESREGRGGWERGMSNSTSRRVEALRRCPSPPGLTNSISSLQGERKFPKNTRTHAGTGDAVSSRD